MKKEKKQGGNQDLQDLHDIFTGQGMKLAEGAIKQIQGKQDPQTIADAVLGIIARVEDEGRKNGIKFPLEIVFTAGKDVLVYILHNLGIEDKGTINQIVGIVVGRYLNAKRQTGELTDEQIQQMAQEGPPNGQQAPPQPKGLLNNG